MEVVLIPGFWLDASSWDDVVPVLERAGHTCHPVTLPGAGPVAADRAGVGLQDQVDAVVDLIDRVDGPVALVGHSGGGTVAYLAADARVDRIGRLVLVDMVPPPPGGCINASLPVVDGEIPLPDWEVFDDEDLVDLDDDLRRMFRARAVPVPAAVATDPAVPTDGRRHDLPATVIACEFSGAQLREWLDGGDPDLAELALLRSLTVVDLPTGHWPQFTRPADLGGAMAAAVAVAG